MEETRDILDDLADLSDSCEGVGWKETALIVDRAADEIRTRRAMAEIMADSMTRPHDRLKEAEKAGDNSHHCLCVSYD